MDSVKSTAIGDFLKHTRAKSGCPLVCQNVHCPSLVIDIALLFADVVYEPSESINCKSRK